MPLQPPGSADLPIPAGLAWLPAVSLIRNSIIPNSGCQGYRQFLIEVQARLHQLAQCHSLVTLLRYLNSPKKDVFPPIFEIQFPQEVVEDVTLILNLYD
jgi:hypothetical protein